MASKKPKPRPPRRKPRRRLVPRWRWLALIPAFFAVNWLFHVARIPSQATAPLEPYFYKTPAATWEAHGAAFQAHSTAVMSPALLAALAQVEASGNPIATTYWKWRWSWNPFRWYSPASSAAGLFQITDGTFAESRRFCIHDGKVVQQTHWYDPEGCWFNFLYNRLSANHAAEMTSAYLDFWTGKILSPLKLTPPLASRRATAAVIHLCGVQEATRFVKNGFRPLKGQKCGDHSVAAYLKQVEEYRLMFETVSRRKL